MVSRSLTLSGSKMSNQLKKEATSGSILMTLMGVSSSLTLQGLRMKACTDVWPQTRLEKPSPKQNCWCQVRNFKVATGQEMVKIKNKFFKVRKFYFESGKIDILKKSQGKLEYDSADFIQLMAGRNISGQCDSSDVFFLGRGA